MATVIVGIDPGITTGLALVSDNGTNAWVVNSASLLASDLLLGLNDEILSAFLSRPATIVAIEDTPVPTTSEMNKTLSAVIRYLIKKIVESGIGTVTYIPPGVWKNSPEGVAKRSELFSQWHPNTRHEEDAARIATYAYRRGSRGEKETE